jgi:hypothetical protein
MFRLRKVTHTHLPSNVLAHARHASILKLIKNCPLTNCFEKTNQSIDYRKKKFEINEQNFGHLTSTRCVIFFFKKFVCFVVVYDCRLLTFHVVRIFQINAVLDIPL